MQNKSADQVRQRAQTRFEQATSRAREAAAAMKDFHAVRAAEAEKLVRLRNQRLAKEAADALARRESEMTTKAVSAMSGTRQPGPKKRRQGSAAVEGE